MPNNLNPVPDEVGHVMLHAAINSIYLSLFPDYYMLHYVILIYVCSHMYSYSTS